MRAAHSLLLIGTALGSAAFAQEPSRAETLWPEVLRPAIERSCVRCHGPQRQRRGLRLDSLAALRFGGQSGAVLVPGDAERSLIVKHVEGRDGKKKMPAEGEPLAPNEIAALRTWIDAGATGDDGIRVDPREFGHWAYRPVRRPDPPLGSTHPVDAFVLARLRPLADRLAPEAPRATLVRRLWLDLTGLPPALAELDRAEHDASPEWWPAAVDRALASPHFGERWAAWWLDLARYADTRGYEKDDRRSIWRWRDWVIDAFDKDLPFDRFTTLQLAGDLQPGATTDDMLATAFHRNTMTNDEGGTDDEEFRVAAVLDRVTTTFAVWMGTTINCAQCHDHKYDPISRRDFYGVYAFFDQTADADKGDESPTILTPTPEETARLAALDATLAATRAQLARPIPPAALEEFVAGLRERVRDYEAMHVELGPWRHSGPWQGADFDDAWQREFAPEHDGTRDVAWTARPDWTDGIVHADLPGTNVAHYLTRTLRTATRGRIEFALGSDDALEFRAGDRIVLEKKVSRAAAPDQERVSVDVQPGETRLLLKVVNGGGPAGFFFRAVGVEFDAPIAAAIAVDARARDAEQTAVLEAAFRERDDSLGPLRGALANLEKERAAVSVARTPVLLELPAEQRRTTRMFNRGSFLDPGDTIGPGVPGHLGPFRPEWPLDRRGLARWIVDPANPLTARVTVNRIWEQLFGRGIVETTEDFGQQGESPSHPELLDWLAAEFVARGWSLKSLLRSIVTSATYRQDSSLPPWADQDPYNLLLGRGPALRLPAEAVRDSALAIAGLLSDRKFGPSVMPPQPEGIWRVVYSGDRWQTSAGEDAYRRGLYTFWRRTSPYPSMVTFDAPSREFCVVRRSRSNTPLQALVTLNDPAFVACARAFARRVIEEAPGDDGARIEHAFRLATARRPAPDERARLARLLAEERAHFASARDDAEQLVATPAGDDAPELAAWTMLAHVLLNLDEVLVKR